jgi:serine/threonine protein kinase
MGTPEYAPPEQYDTYAGHTGPQSDIYGVGATLYHALTGQPPPTATQRIASRTIFKPPRALNPRISQRTEAAVLRAMALTVEDRFPTAGEMAEGARVLRGGAVAPTPTRVTSGKRAVTSPRRRVLVTRVLLSVAASCVLVVCLGLVWSVLTGGDGTVVTPTVRATAKPSITKLAPTLTATPSKTPRPSAVPAATSTRVPRPTSTVLTPTPTSIPIPTSTPVPPTWMPTSDLPSTPGYKPTKVLPPTQDF